MMEINKMLRDTQSLMGPFPVFDDNHLTEEPFELFQKWYGEAVEHGTAEPNNMVLGTVRKDNQPDSRVVLLKAVDEDGFYFESGRSQKKVRQIDMNSKVSLNFYWQPVGRQVRAAGTAVLTEEFTHVSENLDAAARALNVYKVIPDEFEFYQALSEGGYVRVKYSLENGRWIHEWIK